MISSTSQCVNFHYGNFFKIWRSKEKCTIGYLRYHQNIQTTTTTSNNFRNSSTYEGERNFNQSTTYEGREKVKTNKNINYPPTLPPKFPSIPVTDRYTAAAANTVYDRIQQSIGHLKEKYGTKPTEATTQINIYNKHSTTESPAPVSHTYTNLATNYLVEIAYVWDLSVRD